MNDREEYIEKLKAQLDSWNQQLGAWESATRAATREAKAELEKQVGILRSRADDMVYRMELMKSASAEAWQEIQRGAEAARSAMESAFDKARSRFKDL